MIGDLVGFGSWLTYEGLHGAVESVTVVAAELGVNTLEGRVTVGLRLLDTVWKRISVIRSCTFCGEW
jgi:hypothetical protein